METFDGDAFFPELEQGEWKLISNRDCAADAKNPYALSFQVWERKPHLMPPSPKGSNGSFIRYCKSFLINFSFNKVSS
jgi:hypothetical protein